MEYRIHPKTKERISVIGIGTGPVFEASERDAVEALTYKAYHTAEVWRGTKAALPVSWNAEVCEAHFCFIS